MNWEKIKDFFGVLLVASLVFMLMGSSGNYERAIYSGSIVFVLYYSWDKVVSNLKNHDEDTKLSKITDVLAFLAYLWIFGNILSYVISGVTRLDYCNGWAESEQYCAIQKIKENYDTDLYDEGY